MKRVLLVTQEFYPHTLGGIGKLISEVARELSQEGHEVTILFSGVDIECAQDCPYEVMTTREVLNSETSRTNAFQYSTFYPRRVSQEIAFAISILNYRGRIFDVIEFPDYMGLAFSALNFRSESKIDASQRICVRIHSSLLALRKYDSGWSADLRCQYSMEYFSLLNCDLLVFHVEGVKQHLIEVLSQLNNRELPRHVVKMPSLGIKENSINREGIRLSANEVRLIMFTSKLQPFKRPDIFIKGVQEFLANNKVGREDLDVFLMARDPSTSFSSQLREMIYTQYRSKFTFDSVESYSEREQFMKDNVVVFTSEYESLCLAAFEASFAGAIVILNEANPAFSDKSRWIDGVNCFKYDGTVFGLANCLEYVFSLDKIILQKVVFSPDSCLYCDASIFDTSITSSSQKSELKVSALIPHRNDSVLIAQLIGYLTHHDLAGFFDEILIVDDCSTASELRNLSHIISNSKFGNKIKLFFNNSNLGLPATRNKLVRLAKNELVYFIDSDDLPGVDFVKQMQTVFSDPKVDLYFGSTLSFTTLKHFEPDILDYFYTYGPDPFSTIGSNRSSSSSFGARKKVLRQNQFDETLEVYEDWDFFARLSQEKYKYVVSEDGALHYRRSSLRMLATSTTQSQVQAKDRILSKLMRGIPGMAVFDSYILASMQESESIFAETFKRRLYIQGKLFHHKLIYKFPCLDKKLTQLAFIIKRWLNA